MRVFGRVKMPAFLACFALSSLLAATAHSETGIEAFKARLDPVQRRQFEAYYAASTAHAAVVNSYWSRVDTKRAERKAKRTAGVALTRDDYVLTFPPEYHGPQLAPDLAKRWAEHQQGQQVKTPRRPLPTVSELLASAKSLYGFVPSRIAEREFKVRYASEALRVGLSKAQVVRIYALETGGQGTADMQAGINPVTKQGRAISSALGYAQLLHGNSVGELVKHGPAFVQRLQTLSAQPGLEAGRAKALQEKLAALRRMYAKARSVPNAWDSHVALGKTPAGLGIHALNLDGDIGPWLQVVKLAGLKEMAEKAGRTTLAPHEMELMNLAGPGTGLEMMLPVARDAPTPNFFSRGGYGRNTIVRGKTAAELLAALDKRMSENMAKPGAVEFAAVFDEILRERQARR